jgi:hypothetical protein
MSKSKGITSHTTLEVIKIPVVLDGDLATTLANVLMFCDEHHFLDDLVFCDHVYPKLDELMEKMHDKLDFENREEP